jgi:hypothetical protein
LTPPGAVEPRRPTRLRGSSLVGALVVLGLALTGPAPVEAQAPAAPAASQAADRSFWSTLAGERMERRRLTAAMWAMHPFEPQFPELDWTWGVAFSWSQWFLATFINSYDERSFIGGIERTWIRSERGPFAAGLGYRVGVVTGYDERLVSWGEHTPVLPFAGVLLWTDFGPVGVDLYYVYRAITLEAALRF